MPTRMKLDSPYGSDVRYVHSATVTDTTSDAVLLPGYAGGVAVAVQPGTNATVQFTLSSEEEVSDGNAVWMDWAPGEVTDDTSDSLAVSVTALRLVSTGASTWQVNQPVSL